MKRMSISRSTFRLFLLLIAGTLPTGRIASAYAQGSSIPKNQEARSQEIPVEVPLPEGQKYRYPLLNGLMLSVNIFDPVLEAITFDHANYEAMLTLDLHHRFMPMVAVGVGHGDDTNDDGVRYKVGMTPYFKLGCGYNLLYNRGIRPGDWYGVFMRYGCSSSRADITGMTYTDGYWQNYGPAEIKDHQFKCHWLELGGSLRVQVMKHFSMGWDLYWRPMIRKAGNEVGDPYFVPGYGVTNVKLGFNFHAIYHIW